MKSADIALVLQNTARRAPARESRCVLRFALCSGELFRIPRDRRHLHVLSGTAWISVEGKDIVTPQGCCAKLVRTRHPTLVSGLGDQALLFEIW
jgi:hypothetical protein